MGKFQFGMYTNVSSNVNFLFRNIRNILFDKTFIICISSDEKTFGVI